MARYFELAAMVALEAAPGTDAVLFNAVAPYGRDIAEGLRVPSIGMFLQPTWSPAPPTRRWPRNWPASEARATGSPET
jgi:hypothetical protein